MQPKNSLLATERSRGRAMAVVVAVMLAILAPRVYAQVRIAVVDMQRALLETNDGRRAKNQLKKLFESRQEQLNRRQEGLKRMKETLEKQARVLDRATLEKRSVEYQKSVVELQQSYMEYQQELAQKEAELTKQILVNLQGVVRQIGQSENFTFILDQGAVIWAPTHVDITDRVIVDYNREHPTASTGGAAASSASDDDDATPDAGARPTPPRPRTPPANPHPRSENQQQQQ